MQLLLDTHIALWAITDDKRLAKSAKNLIINARNQIWVSTVSIWEIAIKYRIARGDMPIGSEEATDYFKASGFMLLPIQPEHAMATEALPDHHQDPFDRLLIAQSLQEPMRLITHDSMLAKYSDTVILV